MAYRLTPAEKETIFLWSEADDVVQITTYNRPLIKRLRDAHEKSPELYRLRGPDCYGGFDAEMPRELLQITFRQPLSEERRAELAENAKKYFSLKGEQEESETKT